MENEQCFTFLLAETEAKLSILFSRTFPHSFCYSNFWFVVACWGASEYLEQEILVINL
jgi:hypothetical protein